MMTSRDPYESECFSFMGATTSSEPQTSMANESHERASMMSPMPGKNIIYDVNVICDNMKKSFGSLCCY